MTAIAGPLRTEFIDVGAMSAAESEQLHRSQLRASLDPRHTEYRHGAGSTAGLGLHDGLLASLQTDLEGALSEANEESLMRRDVGFVRKLAGGLLNLGDIFTGGDLGTDVFGQKASLAERRALTNDLLRVADARSSKQHRAATLRLQDTINKQRDEDRKFRQDMAKRQFEQDKKEAEVTAELRAQDQQLRELTLGIQAQNAHTNRIEAEGRIENQRVETERKRREAETKRAEGVQNDNLALGPMFTQAANAEGGDLKGTVKAAEPFLGTFERDGTPGANAQQFINKKADELALLEALSGTGAVQRDRLKSAITSTVGESQKLVDASGDEGAMRAQQRIEMGAQHFNDMIDSAFEARSNKITQVKTFLEQPSVKQILATGMNGDPKFENILLNIQKAQSASSLEQAVRSTRAAQQAIALNPEVVERHLPVLNGEPGSNPATFEQMTPAERDRTFEAWLQYTKK